MKISRRNFIGLTLTSGVFALYNNQIFANTNFRIKKQKVLVLIEMRGGNDGLNTIIPFRNSIYYSQRPNISINNFFSSHNGIKLSIVGFNESSLFNFREFLIDIFGL